MAKRNTRTAKQQNRPDREGSQPPAAADVRPPLVAARRPAKNLALLALSILLFALWFIFLLVTALSVDVLPPGQR